MLAFRNWREERRQRRALAGLRESMAALGYPIDDMADEEILDGCTRLGETLAQTGVAAAAFGDALVWAFKEA